MKYYKYNELFGSTNDKLYTARQLERKAPVSWNEFKKDPKSYFGKDIREVWVPNKKTKWLVKKLRKLIRWMTKEKKK